ncbi:2S seed storage albumin protein-like [Mercurialis annua]|uniref:2S seed storage albumin protein-like n=1 Tax=Mercurialis annua TaxID=3986 RepID=UPI00215F284C|nr:2S seed storage albumin protein-like [Mercurialis annua]
MAKLIPTVALISILLIIIADASSARRTIITTVEIDGTNPTGGGEGQCREEVEKQELSSCVQYMRQLMSGKSEGGGEGKQQLQQCCSRLKQVRDDCQCPAIKSAYQEMRGEVMRDQWPRVIIGVSLLPSTCGLSQEFCKIES